MKILTNKKEEIMAKELLPHITQKKRKRLKMMKIIK